MSRLRACCRRALLAAALTSAACRPSGAGGGSAEPPGPPQVAEVWPPIANIVGGERVTLTGANFSPDVAISLGGKALTNVVFEGPDRVSGIAPKSTATRPRGRRRKRLRWARR